MPVRSVLAAAFSIGFVAAARADTIHLYGGGVIDGRVVAHSTTYLRLQTLAGELLIPTNTVKEHVRGESLVERYAHELDREPISADRHVALALWCTQEHAFAAAARHARAALDLDPQNEDALRLAGYIQLGGVWLFTEPAAPPPNRGVGGAAIIDRLLAGWRQRVRRIADAHLAQSATVDSFDEGRRQLLDLRTPLVVPGACEVLGDTGAGEAIVLVEMLDGIDSDAATINLLALALTHQTRDAREAASVVLRKRSDQRVGTVLRLALRCQSEMIVRRAAAGLGWMADRSAVADLIDVLLPRSSPVQPIGVAALFGQIAATFNQPTLVPIDDPPVPLPPAVALPGFDKTVKAIAATESQPAGSYRSEVQDALIAITGENHGFDVQAWRDWLARHPPIEQVAP